MRRRAGICAISNAYDEDREDCLAAGMDDYLSKPLQKELLEAALERVPQLARQRDDVIRR